MTECLIQSNHAVKAIIYRDDGRILLQQRDDIPGLPFPGCWNFFGGLAEAGEAPGEALERELTEELGCIPGKRGPELFTWEWRSAWTSTRNHFFPVRLEVATSSLVQKEGQSMAWFSMQDLVELPLTPAVYETFSRIAEFFANCCPNLVSQFEERLLAFNDLKKKNDRVFYARENPCALSRQQIVLLKELACMRKTPVFRVCMHTDDQCDIHEMLMVHTSPASVGPLKQNKTSLSYHVIEGSLTIKMHDDTGVVLKEYFLGEGRPSELRSASIRLNARKYRSVHSTSPFSIFLEVASGPFQDSDTLWLKPRS